MNNTPLWDHQQTAIDAAKNSDYYGLFFAPGTGKTRTTIEILIEKYAQFDEILPTFIFCPPVVVSNWKSEFLKYSLIPEYQIIPLVGPGKKRLKTLSEANKNSIFITNYETLLMTDVLELMESVLRNSPVSGVVVGDELHKIKSHDSRRAKGMHRLALCAKYRFGLTGTPVLNSLEDLFSEFLFLDKGERFGKNYWGFRKKFFQDKNAHMPTHVHFPNWQLKPGAESQLLSAIGDCTMSAKKEDCLDLPPLVKKIVEVEMGSEQKRLYEQMKRDLVATMTVGGEARASIAEMALTKALRLQQIVSGHIKLEGGSGEEGMVVSLKDNPRKDALKQLLEDITPAEKVIVWAVFKDNYTDIRDVCESLKIKYMELHGETKDKDASVDAFNNDESVRVLISHPGAGGVGVNLVSSSCSIYYSRNFSLEFDIQSEARNYRGGSERHEKVTRIDLVCKNTIDELVLTALSSKTALSETVLRACIGAF
jgi:SNF2 family DNA or RNA helicase